jgi:hypothetical protein
MDFRAYRIMYPKNVFAHPDSQWKISLDGIQRQVHGILRGIPRPWSSLKLMEVLNAGLSGCRNHQDLSRIHYFESFLFVHRYQVPKYSKIWEFGVISGVSTALFWSSKRAPSLVSEASSELGLSLLELGYSGCWVSWCKPHMQSFPLVYSSF